MKKILLTLLLTLIATFNAAAHEDVIHIYPKSGEKKTIHVDEIDSLYFSPAADHLFIQSQDGLLDYAIASLDSLVFAEADEHHHEEGEEEVAKIQLTLAKGHFHGTKFHQDADPEGINYKKSVQHITLVKEGNKWVPEAGSADKFIVLSGITTQTAYGLWVKYYAEDGDELTGTFFEDGADQKHQHFFTPKNVAPTFDGTAEANDNDVASLFSYTYMDTDPWNKTLKEGAKLVGSKVIGQDTDYNNIYEAANAVGLKGFFNFNKVRKTFDLNIRLMHADGGKYINGKVSPFHSPTNGQLAANHIELNYSVPVVIFADNAETAQWEADSEDEDGNPTTFEQLSETEQKLILSLAKAYNISKEEAMKEWFLSIEGDVNAESGSLWF